MHVALALYRYFPHGGLQRDFLATAQRCVERGHRVTLLAAQWDGPVPEGMKLVRLPSPGWSNHTRMRRFGAGVVRWRALHADAVVVGFNRLPGLDLYFAADNCFAANLQHRAAPLRLVPRYRSYWALEQAVFGPEGAESILFLNGRQARGYLAHYALAEHRYCILPPGVRRDRRPGADAGEQRRQLRAELGIADSARVLLFLGSDFARKGLDRVVAALVALPQAQRASTVLLVVGDDNPGPYQAELRREGIDKQVWFTGGRDDVPALLQAADLLVHPAYEEPAGMALLEATVAGLPVLTSGACGYAEYIEEAGSGRVVTEPFDQKTFETSLIHMLEVGPQPWSDSGLEFGKRDSLYALHERIVDEIEALDPHEN